MCGTTSSSSTLAGILLRSSNILLLLGGVWPIDVLLPFDSADSESEPDSRGPGGSFQVCGLGRLPLTLR